MGVRAGQGFGAAKPKRLRCPSCGKRGVTQWRVTPSGCVRHCQFCHASWGEDGWRQALAAADHAAPHISAQDLALLAQLSLSGAAAVTPPLRPQIERLIEAGVLQTIPLRYGPLALQTGEVCLRLTDTGRLWLEQALPVIPVCIASPAA